MTNGARQGGPGAEPTGAPIQKKAYSSPKLTRLGSVRELTLNGRGTITDGNGFMMMGGGGGGGMMM